MTAYIEEQKIDNHQKITEVTSCSDCCKIHNPDGTPNRIGFLHRMLNTVYINDMPYLDCRHCPVFQNMAEEEYALMLKDIDGTE